MIRWLVGLCVAVVVIGAFEVPCTERLVDGPCAHDNECYGLYMYCSWGVCKCMNGFEGIWADSTNTTKICRPAPDRVGAACLDTCKPPLLCTRDGVAADQMGRCACVDGEISGGRCMVACPAGKTFYGDACRSRVANVNEACTENDDCVDAFTECHSTGSGRNAAKRCTCVEGTTYDSSRRVCAGRCPDGRSATTTCSRLYVNDVDLIEHEAKGDTCRTGEYCVTYGSPGIGHCCPVLCPLGTADTAQSCDAGSSNRCRSLTHFCHTIQSPGYSTSICCPRPCRQPTPIYANGTCHRASHYGDKCTFDGQCDGGTTMQCQRGLCKCRSDYSVINDGSTRFPTCAKVCRKAKEVPVGASCVDVTDVKVADDCFVDEQCPKSATCRLGKCRCKCGLEQENGACVDPNDRLGLGTQGTQFLSTIQALLGG